MSVTIAHQELFLDPVMKVKTFHVVAADRRVLSAMQPHRITGFRGFHCLESQVARKVINGQHFERRDRNQCKYHQSFFELRSSLMIFVSSAVIDCSV